MLISIHKYGQKPRNHITAFEIQLKFLVNALSLRNNFMAALRIGKQLNYVRTSMNVSSSNFRNIYPPPLAEDRMLRLRGNITLVILSIRTMKISRTTRLPFDLAMASYRYRRGSDPGSVGVCFIALIIRKGYLKDIKYAKPGC